MIDALLIFLLRADSNASERQEIKAIGIGAITLFRDRLNASKLSPRFIGRNKETQTKEFEFNQAGNELGSIVLRTTGGTPSGP